MFHEHLLGEMMNDMFNGKGIKYFTNGDIYEMKYSQLFYQHC